MEKIGSEAARRQLPGLLDKAHSGKASLIMKRGKPYAILASPDQWQMPSNQPGLMALRGSGKGLWGKKPSATINTLRNEWE